MRKMPSAVIVQRSAVASLSVPCHQLSKGRMGYCSPCAESCVQPKLNIEICCPGRVASTVLPCVGMKMP